VIERTDEIVPTLSMPSSSRLAPVAALALLSAGCATGSREIVRRPVPESPRLQQEQADTTESDFRYHPASGGSYSYHRLDSIEYRLPTGSQTEVHGRTLFLTIGLEPDDSVYRVGFRLDSIRQDPGTTYQPALDSLRLVHWSGEMPPTGGLWGIRVSPSSPFGERLGAELARRFFPAQPVGGARPGMEWTDSAQISVTGLSVSQSDLVESRSSASAPSSDGPPSLRIETESRLERQGSSTQTGEIVQEAGSGLDSTTSYVDLWGRFLRSEGKESFDLLFSVPAVGQKVAVRQLSHYRILRLPEQEAD
jgi:hypothetical protein